MTTAPTRPPDIKVEDIMTKTVHSITLTMTIRESIQLLTVNKVSGAPVVDNIHNVVSVMSEGDCLRLAAMPGGMDQVIGKCLTHLPKTDSLITCKASDSFTDVYKSFLQRAVHRILVVDASGKLHGVVSRSNVLRMMVEPPKLAANQ